MDQRTTAERGLSPGSTIGVVGASARAAVTSLLRAGYRAVAADLFADADLTRICPVTRIDEYPAGLVAWLRKTPCDGWIYTGALENYPELIDEMAALRPLLGNPGNVLRRVRDPLVLQAAMRANELPFPETHTTSSGLPRDGSWLAKVVRGGGGTGVCVWNGATTAGEVWQKRIAGDSGSAVFAGCQLLAVTRQLVGEEWTGAKPFQYSGTIAPWDVCPQVEDDLHKLGHVLGAEFGLVGLYGVDFVLAGGRPWIVEVNPRYTAAVEVVEQALKTGLLNWHVANHHLRNFAPNQRGNFAGKAIMFSKRRGKISGNFVSWALEQVDLADVPPQGTVIEPGQPVLTILAKAESFALILPTLKSRMLEVDIRLWGGAGSCGWVS